MEHGVLAARDRVEIAAAASALHLFVSMLSLSVLVKVFTGSAPLGLQVLGNVDAHVIDVGDAILIHAGEVDLGHDP